MQSEEFSDSTSQEGDLARQTAQAKLLREARDQLAQLVPKLTKAELLALGVPETSRDRINRQTPNQPAAHLADELRNGQPFTSVDLAEVLGVSLPTLRSWLAPSDNNAHRPMPTTAKRLLARILADTKRTK